MLDQASESTCLCTNAADAACSFQKFLFDGEVEKVATELKNVVACTSYILERKLVEAWSADKAAEALRCQKLLVEEEDAAQKRQAEIMERKRMKKLRQKEQRLKDLKDEDAIVQLPEMADSATGSTGIQSLEAISGPGLNEQEDPQYLRLPAPLPSEDHGFIGEDATCDSMDTGVASREHAMSTSNLDRLESLPDNSTISGSVVVSKHPSSVRHSRHRDPNASAASNRSKTWAWKVRADVEEGCPKAEFAVDGGHEMAVNTDGSSELLIGSISLATEDGGSKRLQGSEPSEDYRAPDPHLNHPVAKVVQPISHDGDHAYEDESGSPSLGGADQVAGGGSQGGAVFSSKEASAFLSQRWKDAMARDHVKLVLCSEN